MKIRKRSREPRNTVLTIRLSSAEKKDLRFLAEQYGLSVSAFLLMLAFGDHAAQPDQEQRSVPNE